MKQENTSDALVHTANIKEEITGLITHLRKDISRVEDARAKALFEVSAEVLTGLKKAFTDFEEKKEEAWSK